MVAFYPSIGVRWVEPGEMGPGSEESLVNVNTPEELRRVRERLGRTNI